MQAYHQIDPSDFVFLPQQRLTLETHIKIVVFDRLGGKSSFISTVGRMIILAGLTSVDKQKPIEKQLTKSLIIMSARKGVVAYAKRA